MADRSAEEAKASGKKKRSGAGYPFEITLLNYRREFKLSKDDVAEMDWYDLLEDLYLMQIDAELDEQIKPRENQTKTKSPSMPRTYRGRRR